MQAILQEMKELYADNEDASPSKGSVDLSVDNVVVTLGYVANRKDQIVFRSPLKVSLQQSTGPIKLFTSRCRL